MFIHYLLIIIISIFFTALNTPHLSLFHYILLFNLHKCTSRLRSTTQIPTDTMTQTDEQDRLDTTITLKQYTYTTFTMYTIVKQIIFITFDYA